MDGLECSEILFSQIDLGDRFDSDYYTKNYLHISDQMSKVPTEKLGKLATTVASAFYPAATQLYSEGDTAFARCVDCVSYPVITKDQDSKFEKIPYSIKKINESFAISGRLDAEYYQPKYDILFDELKKFSCKRLGGPNGIVNIKKSIEPGSEAYTEDGIPFVRVSDISKFGISEPDIKLRSDIIPNPEVLFPPKDTILLSKDGSVGIAYKVEATMPIITSGALLHLKVRDKTEVLPDYLTLVLNSPVVQLQAERDSNGAIIQHWKPSEIENVIIPILGMDTQKEIAAKVQEAFTLRKQSKQLLEYAKQAVEMAIEQGEDVALAWLKDKIPVEV